MENKMHNPTMRVLDILEVLSNHKEGLSLTEISKKINSPKSTILPMLRTMVNRNFIRHNENSNLYSIGINSYLVGASYYSKDNIIDFIKKEMENIVSKTGEICQLGIRDHSSVVYVAKVDSNNTIRLISYVGKRLPLHTSALGKALLYKMPEEKIDTIIPEKLEAFTPFTLKTRKELKTYIFNEVNKEKYAYEISEASTEIACFAIPICYQDNVIAAISVSIPIFRLTSEKKIEIKNILKHSGMILEQGLKNLNWNKEELLFY